LGKMAGRGQGQNHYVGNQTGKTLSNRRGEGETERRTRGFPRRGCAESEGGDWSQKPRAGLQHLSYMRGGGKKEKEGRMGGRKNDLPWEGRSVNPTRRRMREMKGWGLKGETDGLYKQSEKRRILIKKGNRSKVEK